MAQLAEAADTMPSDVQLIAADGSKHNAHRLILSAWSPFFKSMFSSGMREHVSGEVHLPDVPPSQLLTILAWMHAREIEIPQEQCAFLELMELARRWQLPQLYAQLSESGAGALNETNLQSMWESAECLSLEQLEKRCKDFAMSLVSKSSLSPILKSLQPKQFRELIESDELPVSSEEEALKLVLAYLEATVDTSSPLTELQDSILLAVRWRLIPGPAIAKMMLHPMLLDGSQVRSAILPALADGMQFQLLGGLVEGLAPSSANKVRTMQRIPLPAFEFLRVGMQVRIHEDVKTLRSLCLKRAPGAQGMAVDWEKEMKSYAGKIVTIKDVCKFDCAGKAALEGIEEMFHFPWNALFFA
jgi:hypothetical protein